jgi:hypothetical protein
MQNRLKFNTAKCARLPRFQGAFEEVFRPMDLLSAVYSDFRSVVYIPQCVNLELIANNVAGRRHVQSVPLATEPGISLIILPLMRILQRNLKRTYLIV